MPLWSWVPRWAMAVAAVFLVVLVAGSGTVAASSDAVPGDTLYSVKTASERVRLFFATSDGARARLEAEFAGRRVREMARIARRGDTVRLEALRMRFNEHLERIDELAEQIAGSDLQNAARIAELEEILNRNMARDDVLLEETYQEAPEVLQPVIDTARTRLMESYEGAIDALRARYGQQTSDGGGTGGGWFEMGGTMSPGSGIIWADPVAGSTSG